MLDLYWLEILGLVLASLAGIFFVALAFALFVPINYSIKVNGEDKDIEGNLAANWLGILRAGVVYADGEVYYEILLFGIKLKREKLGAGKEKIKLNKKSASKEKKKSKKKLLNFKKKKEKTDEIEKEPVPDKPVVSRETVIKMLEEQKEKEKRSANFFNNINLGIFKGKKEKVKKQDKPKKTFKEQFNSFWIKIQKAAGKASDVKNKAFQIKRLLETKTGQRTIAFIKLQIIKLLKALKPKSIRGFVKYGLDDPATTAKIYGFAAQATYLFTNDRLMVIPEFERKCIELDLTINGNIYLIKIATIVIKILMNQDIIRIKKEIGRITNGGQN